MIGHAMPVYQGYSSQYGRGLGNVLGGLVRAAMPIVTKLAKTAGAKLLNTGLDYANQHFRPDELERRRVMTRRVKRPASHPYARRYKKKPPGVPVRKVKRRRAAAPSPRDIFTA